MTGAHRDEHKKLSPGVTNKKQKLMNNLFSTSLKHSQGVYHKVILYMRSWKAKVNAKSK